MRKKLLCGLLLLVMTLGLFQAYGAPAGDVEIVLVLDNSGSMSGVAIQACQNAAREFCSAILQKDSGCKIGMVLFSDEVDVCEFTNNYDTLNSYISKMNASGGTDIDLALRSANSLLRASTSGSISKNIVIMADGLPEHGNKTDHGPYTSNDSSFYLQANTVYSTAVDYFSSYSIYTLGFFHSMKSNTIPFARRFLNDIQNSGYFETSDIGQLIAQFINIANEILVPPLSIKLSYENIGTPYESNYKITATVKNEGQADAQNVKAKIKPIEGMAYINGSVQENYLNNLEPGASVATSWEMSFDAFAAEKEYQFAVAAGADNAVGIEQFLTVKVVPKVYNNMLTRTDDMWGFSHGSVGSYAISDRYRDYLASKLSNTESEEIIKIINASALNGWGGSCHGMSRAAILMKIGRLTPTFWNQNAAVLNDLIPTDSIDLINYYYFLQYVNPYTTHKANFNINHSQPQALQELVELAENVDDGGYPVLTSFSWEEMSSFLWYKWVNKRHGHAIVAYDVNRGSYEIGGNTYEIEVVTYDINTNEGFDQAAVPSLSYIYIKDDFSAFTIPNYFSKDVENSKISCLTSTLNVLDPYNIEKIDYIPDTEKNMKAYLTAVKTTDFLIKQAGSSAGVMVNGLNAVGSLNVWTYYSELGPTEEPALNVVLPDNAGDYRVETPAQPAELALTMHYENSMSSVTASNGSSASFGADGSVAMEGSSTNFEVSMTHNEGSYQLPWHTVCVSGNMANAIGMKKDEDGIILSGDNLKNVIVNAKGKTSSTESVISTQLDVIKIGADNESLSFYADMDGDGTFETDVTQAVTSPQSMNLWNTIISLFSTMGAWLRHIWELFLSLFRR